MKNTLLVLFIFSSAFMIAQDVVIPDANFLAALIDEGVDTNGDGVIQVSEAEVVEEIDVSDKEISDLTGIEAFDNLELLDCNKNNLTVLDVSNNIALKELDCSINSLTELDVNNNLALQVLTCRSNNLTELDFTNNLVLKNLICWNNSLVELNVSNNIALEVLFCLSNSLTELDISNNFELRGLRCQKNNLIELNVSSNLLLELLECGENSLTELNVSSNLALEILDCSSNSLTELDVSNNLALEGIFCEENSLTELDLSNNLALRFLNCSLNSLTAINVSQNINLEGFGCAFCQFEYLDFSENPVLRWIEIPGSFVATINIANGFISDAVSSNTGALIIKNDSLKYLCVDEEESAFVKEYLGDQVSINTYCNFSLNDGLNCMQGKNQYDLSGNCDDNSITVTQVPFSIQDSTQEYKWWPAYTNETFKMFFPSGPHVVKHCLDTTLFVSTPDSVAYDFLGVTDTVNQDFCVTPNGLNVTDLSITFIPQDIARAGFDTNYKIIIENLGNTFSTGMMTLSFPQDSVQITGASEPYTSSGNVATWAYSDLPVLSRKTIYVSIRNNSPMDTPPIVGGEVLKFSAEVIPDMTDINPIDNVTTICETVVNSYDPNDKRCLQGNVLKESMIGTYLDYMIRFENTGSAEAVNITVKDTLDANVYDVASFRLTDSSHPVNVSQQGNIIEFIFNDIYLPFQDSINDGYVTFKIKTSDQLVLGDSISNKAYIYFDFNWPIITNDAFTTVGNIDLDNDGFNSFEDCDDLNASINPDQIEITYNGIDDDCDPLTLDDDLDQDGFGISEDCDDNNDTVYPDAPELCDEVDNNCNETIDEGLPTETYYIDNDNDGFGDIASAVDRCAKPDGYIETGEDCDDNNPEINPDASEIPNNGIDEDCDGEDLISVVDNLEALGISIFPNPVSDILNITQQESRSLIVELYDVEGRKVHYTVIGQKKNNIDLSNIVSGVYFINISSKEQVMYQKLIVR